MRGLRRTGQILAVALVPWLTTGCASTNSRLNSVAARSAEEQQAAWARAQQLEQSGQLAAAQQAYAELHRRNPKSPQYAHRLGVVCTMLGDHERAKTAYARARELDPANPELLADMGYAAILRKEYPEAEALLRASLESNSANPRAVSNLALAVGLQGNDEECLALFRQVHGQDEAEVLCSVAYVRAQRGDNRGAIELYNQALAIDPDLKKASVAIAELKSKPPTEQVAQGKPYRKYMGEHAPKPPARPHTADIAVEAPAPAERAVSVALAEDTSDEQSSGTLAATDAQFEQEVDPAPAKIASANADARRSEAWEKAPAEAFVPPVTRDIPEDSIEELAAREARIADESAAAEAQHQETAAADEDAWVASDQAAAEPAAVSDELAAVFQAPEEARDQSAQTQFDTIEPFSPAWVTTRNEQITARNSQAGFMGYCPVALRDEQKLVDALPQYQAVYQHQTYEFGSEEALRKFEAQPERYLAAAGGLDVVAVSQGTAVAQGSLEHALWFRHRLYLFLNRENMDAFRLQTRQFAVQD
jgi:Flp pilus assembly protein TadD/YHS domain-containing protein